MNDNFAKNTLLSRVDDKSLSGSTIRAMSRRLDNDDEVIAFLRVALDGVKESLLRELSIFNNFSTREKRTINLLSFKRTRKEERTQKTSVKKEQRERA